MNAQPEVKAQPEGKKTRKVVRNPVELVDLKALTIDEFCKLHSISRFAYYELRKQGRGPQIMFVGKRARITAEAAAKWRRQMEAEAERSGADK
jgi:hypothetical protein